MSKERYKGQNVLVENIVERLAEKVPIEVLMEIFKSKQRDYYYSLCKRDIILEHSFHKVPLPENIQ